MDKQIELQGGEMLCVKSHEAEFMKADDTGNILAIVSTENEDSDGDVIHQGKTKNGAGWLLERFNKMPVILWQHDSSMPNLSDPKTRAKKAKDEKLGRVLTLNPLKLDEGDELAMHLQGKMDRRVIRETSVGFIGKVFEPRRGDGDRFQGYEFFEQELIEVSLVNRGANFDTDTQIKSLLGSSYVTAKIEDGGSSEIIELKELIAELETRLGVNENALKRMDDLIQGGQEDPDVLKESLKYEVEMDLATRDLVKALRRSGSAHY